MFGDFTTLCMKGLITLQLREHPTLWDVALREIKQAMKLR